MELPEELRQSEWFVFFIIIVVIVLAFLGLSIVSSLGHSIACSDGFKQLFTIYCK